MRNFKSQLLNLSGIPEQYWDFSRPKPIRIKLCWYFPFARIDASEVKGFDFS